MKKLIINILLLVSPLILLFISFLVMDPFNLVHNKLVGFKSITQEAYDVSKMNVCDEMELTNYNSFVFGNSKCNGFRSSSWKGKLNDNDSILNLSSPGENITHIVNKIKYLKENNAKLKNAMLVLDDNIFKNHKGTYLIGPVYLHHTISTNKIKLYNIGKGFSYFLNDFYFYQYFNKCMQVNNSDNEFILLTDKDRVKRYNHTLEIFSKNDSTSEQIIFDSLPQVNYSANYKDSIKLLEIKNLFDQDNTDYRIIIGPYSNNTHFSNNLKKLCIGIFGNNRFYDYSAIDKYKFKKAYWQDKAHFTPQVGNEIYRN